MKSLSEAQERFEDWAYVASRWNQKVHEISFEEPSRGEVQQLKDLEAKLEQDLDAIVGWFSHHPIQRKGPLFWDLHNARIRFAPAHYRLEALWQLTYPIRAKSEMESRFRFAYKAGRARAGDLASGEGR